MNQLVKILDNTKKLTTLSTRYFHGVHPKHLVGFEQWFVPYLNPFDNVLDVGCDTHFKYSIIAAKHANHVYGFDVSIPVDHETVTEKLEIINHDATKRFPYPRKCFNKILFLGVIEHLPLEKVPFTLKEIRRVMTDDGLLLLSLPNSETPWKMKKAIHGIDTFSDKDHKFEPNLRETNLLLKSTGFTIDKCEPITPDTPFSGFIDITSIISLNLYKRIIERQHSKATLHNTTGYHIVAHKSGVKEK